jgi:hypothetical protein
MAARRTATKYAVSQTEKILPPEGLHNARVIRIVEQGTQDTDWGEKFKVQLSFELVDESAVFNEENGEQNFTLHRTYNRSLGAGADLGKAVRAILGKDYVNNAEEIEMDELLDQPCKVMVEYSDDEEYANIIKIFPWKKSDGKCAKAENEPVSCYLDENFDQSVFDTLPDWLQETMAKSDEGQELIEEGLMEWAAPKSKKGKKKPKKKDEDEDEEDEPKSRRRKKAKDDDEEEEEDDEDDEPKSRKRKKTDDDDDEEEESDEDEDGGKNKSSKNSSRANSKDKPKRRGKAADDDDDAEEDSEDDSRKSTRRSKQTTRGARKKR